MSLQFNPLQHYYHNALGDIFVQFAYIWYLG